MLDWVYLHPSSTLKNNTLKGTPSPWFLFTWDGTRESHGPHHLSHRSSEFQTQKKGNLQPLKILNFPYPAVQHKILRDIIMDELKKGDFITSLSNF